MPESPRPTISKFGLILDGSSGMGLAKSFSGGSIQGDIALGDLTPHRTRSKFVNRVRYEDFTVEIGMGMPKAFYDWVRSFFDAHDIARSGEIHGLSTDDESVQVRDFLNAHIREVTVPTLDAASRDNAAIAVRFAARTIRYRGGVGKGIPGTITADNITWQANRFRVIMSSLPTSNVTRIASFTLKHVIEEDSDRRIRTSTPAVLEVPNIELTISMADLDYCQKMNFHHPSLDS